MTGLEHLDESTRETAAQAERMARASRDEPDAGFEARISGSSYRALMESLAGTQETRLLVIATLWRRRALRVAAAIALAGIGWLTVRSVWPGETTGIDTELLTESDWLLVFEDSLAEEVLNDADRLSASIKDWDPADPFGVEEAM
jgi:hypothetical protein